MSDETAVHISTENEMYPVLSISQIGNPEPDEGFLIPVKLLADLNAAYDAVDAAEMAVMRHVADRYPDASYVQSWVRGRERSHDG